MAGVGPNMRRDAISMELWRYALAELVKAGFLRSIRDPQSLLPYLVQFGLTNPEKDIIMHQVGSENRMAKLKFYISSRPAVCEGLRRGLQQIHEPLLRVLDNALNVTAEDMCQDVRRFRTTLMQTSRDWNTLGQWALPRLQQEGCLNMEEVDEISEGKTTLSNVLSRKSTQHWLRFVRFLRQEHSDQLSDLERAYLQLPPATPDIEAQRSGRSGSVQIVELFDKDHTSANQRGDIEELKREKKSLEGKIEELNKKARSREKALKDLIKEKNSVITETNNSKKQLSQIRSDLKAQQTNKEVKERELEDLKKRLSAVEKNIKEKEEKKASLQKEVTQLQERKKLCENENRKLENENKKLEQRRKDLEDEIGKLKQRRENLANENRKLEQPPENLKNKSRELENEICRLEKERESLNGKITELEAQKRSLEKKSESLETGNAVVARKEMAKEEAERQDREQTESWTDRSASARGYAGAIQIIAVENSFLVTERARTPVVSAAPDRKKLIPLEIHVDGIGGVLATRRESLLLREMGTAAELRQELGSVLRVSPATICVSAHMAQHRGSQVMKVKRDDRPFWTGCLDVSKGLEYDVSAVRSTWRWKMLVDTDPVLLVSDRRVVIRVSQQPLRPFAVWHEGRDFCEDFALRDAGTVGELRASIERWMGLKKGSVSISRRKGRVGNADVFEAEDAGWRGFYNSAGQRVSDLSDVEWQWEELTDALPFVLVANKVNNIRL